MNAQVNRHNSRCYPKQIPFRRWQHLENQIIGPFHFENSVTGDSYLDMIRNKMVPQVHSLGVGALGWFQQDGTLPHYAVKVRDFLDEQFPGRWISRPGPVEWSPRSTGLSPVDLFIV